MNRGDDLEDDFVPDELVALSEEEGPEYARLADEDVFVDDEGQSQHSEDDEGEEGGVASTNNPESSIAAKKRKRREKEKEKKVKVCLQTFPNFYPPKHRNSGGNSQRRSKLFKPLSHLRHQANWPSIYLPCKPRVLQSCLLLN